MLAFFAAQIPATIAAALALQFYETNKSSEEAAANKKVEKTDIRSYRVLKQPLSNFIKAIGFTCVLFWFVITGWWFVQPYIALGVVDWPLPFSVFTTFLELY